MKGIYSGDAGKTPPFLFSSIRLLGVLRRKKALMQAAVLFTLPK